MIYKYLLLKMKYSESSISSNVMASAENGVMAIIFKLMSSSCNKPIMSMKKKMKEIMWYQKTIQYVNVMAMKNVNNRHQLSGQYSASDGIS
jgi:hypothetical protein